MVIEQPRTSLLALGERTFELKAARLVNDDKSSYSHWMLKAFQPVAHLILLQFTLWIKKGRLKHITKFACSTINNHRTARFPPWVSLSPEPPFPMWLLNIQVAPLEESCVLRGQDERMHCLSVKVKNKSREMCSLRLTATGTVLGI